MNPLRRSQLTPISLQEEVEQLRAEVTRLTRENLDLKVALSSAPEKEDSNGTQIQALNIQLQAEIKEHKRTTEKLSKLLEVMAQEKDDLEMILETITEHDDAMSDHMKAKLDDAVVMANIDGLTQIPNRRRFDEYLQQNWTLLIPERQPISVLLCDIDFFKRYNDHYGHLAGDTCLTKVAQSLNSVIRIPKDLAARYGGEEFGVILPRTPLKGAVIVAQRMLEGIEKLAIPHEKSETSPNVSMSIGVAHMVPSPSHSFQELLNKADQQLYRAKENGRNQIAFNQMEA